MKFEPEDFKIIKGTANRYGASKEGKICNLLTGKILKDAKHTSGYRCINLRIAGRNKTCLIHHLVMSAWVGNRPSNKETNHKNGLKYDNRLDNLEYVTKKQNCKHALLNNLRPRQTNRTLSDAQVKSLKRILEIRNKYKRYVPSYREIASKFGITHWAVRQIDQGQIWKNN